MCLGAICLAQIAQRRWRLLRESVVGVERFDRQMLPTQHECNAEFHGRDKNVMGCEMKLVVRSQRN